MRTALCFAFTLTIAGSAHAGGALQQAGRALFPVRVSKTAEGGLRVSTYGKINGSRKLLSVKEQGADGIQVTREREKHIIHGTTHSALVITTVQPNGRTNITTKIAGVGVTSENSTTRYKSMSRVGQLADATLKSPVGAAAVMGALGAVMVAPLSVGSVASSTTMAAVGLGTMGALTNPPTQKVVETKTITTVTRE